MNPVFPIIAAVCVALVPPEPTRAVRGLASQVDVDYAPRLRARADQTPNSPILVRVTPRARLQAIKRRIEFIGARSRGRLTCVTTLNERTANPSPTSPLSLSPSSPNSPPTTAWTSTAQPVPG